MNQGYDVLIEDTKIIEGGGRRAFKGNVGITGEKIAAVGNAEGDSIRKIDGSDLVLCPGFIDMHSHGDINLLRYPMAENYVMQGVTTFVGGNCGYSPAPVNKVCAVENAMHLLEWLDEIDPNESRQPGTLPLETINKKTREKLGWEIDWRNFAEFLSRIEKTGISVNYVPLVGHNTIRLAVMGEDSARTATPREIEEMRKHVEEAMVSGAFGLSSGLDYHPGRFAVTGEVIELAKVAQRHGGLYFTHWRHINIGYLEDDGSGRGSVEEATVGRFRGLMEAVEIGRKAKIRVHLSHMAPAYVIYQPHPDFLEEAAARAALDIVDKAREEDVDVAFDVLPTYGANAGTLSSPYLIGALANWLFIIGSKDRLIWNLKVKQFRDTVKKAISSGKIGFHTVVPKMDAYWAEHVIILTCKNRDYEGKTVDEIARHRNIDPVDVIFDILVEDPDTRYDAVDLRMDERSQRVFVKHQAAMIGSDSLVWDTKCQVDHPFTAFATPHQGAYGMFARYFREFVKERTIISLEEAVRKATYWPAQRLGLKDRGIIAEGAYADMVLFDFEKIRDKGTWLEPRQAPEGIEYVLVNGKIAYESTTHTGARTGKVLRHQQATDC